MMNPNEAIKQLKEGAFNGNLKHIYGALPHQLTYHKNRIERIIREHQRFFGDRNDVFVFSAPGRSEICGNHTDHQRGKVLACAVNLDIIGVVSLNNSGKINIKSRGYKMMSIDIHKQPTERKRTSAAIVRGMVSRFIELGFDVGGFDCYTTSDILSGSGLSSSASFEIFIGTAINHLFCDMKKSPIEIAQIGKYAENIFFGKPSGLMDQTASSVGGFVKIDFKNKDKPDIETLTFDLDKLDYSLCIVNTHSSHANLTEDYASITRDMKMVANYFEKDVLRQVDKSEFFSEIPDIRKKIGDRPVLRAMHFYSEQDRVEKGFNHLKKGEIDEFLQIILASGRSSFCYLQNVYTPKDINNQGLSLALALCEKFFEGKEGAYRVHGGGFAGTIQAFVPNIYVKTFLKEMDRVFSKGSCKFLKIRPVGGIKII